MALLLSSTGTVRIAQARNFTTDHAIQLFNRIQLLVGPVAAGVAHSACAFECVATSGASLSLATSQKPCSFRWEKPRS